LRSDAIITRAAYLETGRLTRNAMHIVDAYRMVKRWLKGAGLPSRLADHASLQPPSTTNHAEYRREDFDLSLELLNR